jgi:AcrR family transcriptional regulator
LPKVVDHDARRALILERCFELFARQGYGSVRMRQIAKETGISVGALYHYFPDKESIGRDLFQHAAMRFAADAAQEVKPDMDRAVKLVTLTRFIDERQQELSRLLMLGLDHHRLHPSGRDVTVGTMRSFKGILAGVLELDPAETELLFSVLCGVLVRSVLDPDDVDLPGQIRALA